MLRRSPRPLRIGAIDRRQFIHALGLAGFGIASATYLSGCTPRTPVAEKPAGNAGGVSADSGNRTPQQRFLKEVGGRFKGTKIRIVSEDTAPGLIISRMMKEEFTPLTGIEVDWEIVPLDQVLAKTVQDTLTGAGGNKGRNDIYYWDQAWLARFANDSIHLDELQAKKDLAYPDYKFDDFMPQLVDATASYRGDIVGVPFDIPIFIMMYRKDIFDELKLDVPKTMTDYLNTVKAIHEAKRGQGIYGTVGQWKSGHYALQSEASAWLWSHGGHHFDKDGKPDYVNDANVNGLQYMMELGKYMDPACTGWDWGGQYAAFAQGNAGVLISWSEFFPGFDDPVQEQGGGPGRASGLPQGRRQVDQSRLRLRRNPWHQSPRWLLPGAQQVRAQRRRRLDLHAVGHQRRRDRARERARCQHADPQEQLPGRTREGEEQARTGNDPPLRGHEARHRNAHGHLAPSAGLGHAGDRCQRRRVRQDDHQAAEHREYPEGDSGEDGEGSGSTASRSLKPHLGRVLSEFECRIETATRGPS